MVRFVLLELYDESRGEYVERWFNVDFIRHVEVETNKVMMNGARSPMIVSTTSMNRLLSEICTDIRSCHGVSRVRWYDVLFKKIRKIWKK